MDNKTLDSVGKVAGVVSVTASIIGGVVSLVTVFRESRKDEEEAAKGKGKKKGGK